MVNNDQLEKLKFPIGAFVSEVTFTDEQLDALILVIVSAPQQYRTLAQSLSNNALMKISRRKLECSPIV